MQQCDKNKPIGRTRQSGFSLIIKIGKTWNVFAFVGTVLVFQTGKSTTSIYASSFCVRCLIFFLSSHRWIDSSFIVTGIVSLLGLDFQVNWRFVFVHLGNLVVLILGYY